tara:strand:+ start:818 stop:1069 length:252 start_codon:yes stop_codon:yes gene_type:complete
MSKLSLEEWDAKVGPHLASIRLNAGWIEAYAKKIADHAGLMVVAPAWESEAVEVLKKARDEAASAVLLLNEALNTIAMKPKGE